MGPRPIRVCHLISGLRTGGAEEMLRKLLYSTQGRSLDSSVIALTEETSLSRELREWGVPVTCLGLPRAGEALRQIGSALADVQRQRPQIIQGWMYHGNLGADVLGSITRLPVVWNIRGSMASDGAEKSGTRAAIRIGARRSSGARAIVFDSETSIAQHSTLGFDVTRALHVPNGFDSSRFRADAAARLRVRAELGVPDDTPLVGHVARFHPQKRHDILIAAFARVRARHPDVRLVLVGPAVDARNSELRAWIDAASLADGVILLGERRDLPLLLPAFDLVVLSSGRGEGTPNVLGEAMACEVPVLTTDVGDAAALVGDPSRVAPIDDVGELASRWISFLALPRSERLRIGSRDRARIEEAYSLDRAIRAYESLYRGSL